MDARARRPITCLLGAAALALAAAPAAFAAGSAPVVGTGAVANVAPQTVTLTGSVDPNGLATTYFFQYGPTSAYGASTPQADAGAARRRVAVTADLTGLAPATTYHYRLVARNARGLVKGADRTFRTRRQPLAVTLSATPNPIRFGGAATLSGTLTGTGNAGRNVVLQANPFPYTQGFQTVGNPQVIDEQGTFAFPVLSVPSNTQYRVLIPDKPQVASPIVAVSVAVDVTTHVSAAQVRRGRTIRFSGTIRPARGGARIAIQKLRHGRWITVAGTMAHHAAGRFSRYSKRVRVRRGGTYRVFAGIADGSYASSTGRSVRIHAHR